MTKQGNKNQVAQFLCKPQGGRNYLYSALNSKSEKVFIEALHNVIDAMNKDLVSK